MTTPLDVASEARLLVGPGEGSINRAWALAWRAVRFLERAAETARRARLEELHPGGPFPIGEPVKVLAARCLHASVPRAVTGEAAVTAAVERSADFARAVAEILWREYVAKAAKAGPDVLNDPRRLEALRRTRSVAIKAADEYLAADAAEAEADREGHNARQAARRAAVEAKILAERDARIARGKARRAAAKGVQ